MQLDLLPTYLHLRLRRPRERGCCALLVADLLVPPGVTDPVFAILHEHECLIAPADRLGELREAAVKTFRSAPLPLTSALYQWTGMRPQKVEGQ